MGIKHKEFPNGFSSWQETHYEVVAHITTTMDMAYTMANTTQETQGTGGLYELAESLTDEFEDHYKGFEWDGEFFDTISGFLEEKDRPSIIKNS